ncbi:TRAP transporter small permease [Leucothrix pacifica]|uniref:TRAP transporter small permease protein n=1 Tax=Leucothrix pacifica TaxID=1247513 RepID=A0A317C258_9GAMM|nr:TRAP transporter small permease [Leucothrix pacifica]PWQ92704.1 TRAP transporter permease DctQ [Leucothrix pacifica]
MSTTTQAAPQGLIGRWVNSLEENLIALILGLMTIITFVNVVLRYGFDSGLIWGLEATAILFAWLVLFGMSYCVKITAHLGVDALITYFSPPLRRTIALVVAVICIAYASLLMKGAWDYWANFANLPGTEGRWFPLGFEEKFLAKAWYEVEDIPLPEFLRFLEPMMNEGEAYEKLPRFIPYAILPIGVALFLFRLVQATVRVFKGTSEGFIASHEVEDELEELARERGDK